MILAIWGEEKSGKSTMALTFPKPLFHLDLDVGGYARAAWRLDTKDITSKSYTLPLQIEKMMGSKTPSIRAARKVVGYREVWNSIISDYVDACNNKDIQTIVIDSATQLWSICHTSLLQEKQERQLADKPGMPEHMLREKLQPVEFPNDRMRSVIYAARSYGKNLVLTHYPRNIYKSKFDNKGELVEYKSDEVEPDGFKDTQKLVDIVIWTSTSKEGATAKITKCGLEGLGFAAVGLDISPSYQGILDLKEALGG